MDNRVLTNDDADLSALFGIDVATSSAPKAAEFFSQTCRKCGGSGRYSKRLRCFSCSGTGQIPGSSVRMLSFAENHPAAAAWIEANKAMGGFAAAMAESIATYGRLTDNQLAACERSANAASAPPPPVVSTAKLMAAFDSARAKGLKRPKMRFEAFTASLAPDTGKNPGAVYLKAGETYLGKIAAGKFIASRDATPEQQAAIIATMADPLAATVAYGRRTGNCAICGLELTNAVSIERGIGPICAEKFGF